MPRFPIVSIAAFVAFVGWAMPVATHGAAADGFDDKKALEISQAAIGRTLADHAFLDRNNGVIRLADFKGKPLVVNLIYTSCSHTCPLIASALVKAVKTAEAGLGRGAFSVVTVGFDTKADTPARMRAFARTQGIDLPNWHFLSADAATIDRLADETGFIFFASMKGFDHLAQISILDGMGRVYRQVYGADFEPQLVVEPLKELIYGRAAGATGWEGIVNRVKLFCTIYDPASGRYRFDYRVVIMVVVGGLTLSGIGIFAVSAWVRARRRENNARA